MGLQYGGGESGGGVPAGAGGSDSGGELLALSRDSVRSPDSVISVGSDAVGYEGPVPVSLSLSAEGVEVRPRRSSPFAVMPSVSRESGGADYHVGASLSQGTGVEGEG